jgi:hypothetical protein
MVPSPRRLQIEFAGAVALGAIVVGLAAWFGDGDLARIVGFAYVALLPGAAALRLTWPQYQRWRESVLAVPQVSLRLQMAEDVSLKPHPITAGGVHLRGRERFVLQVVISNIGRGTMHSATVNIIVPTLLALKPLDRPAFKTHYPAVLPAENDRITDDRSLIDVHYTVVRAEITPGDHVFHTLVIRPSVGIGPWNLLVELSGDPAPPEDQRFTRVRIHRT